MTTLDNSRISKHLGQVSEYKDQYDPSLLVKEPRSNNRKHLDIQDNNLPFGNVSLEIFVAMPFVNDIGIQRFVWDLFCCGSASVLSFRSSFCNLFCGHWDPTRHRHLVCDGDEEQSRGRQGTMQTRKRPREMCQQHALCNTNRKV